MVDDELQEKTTGTALMKKIKDRNGSCFVGLPDYKTV